MNGFPSRSEVERIKKQYPVGTRIELISVDDPHAPIESGMQGVIKMLMMPEPCTCFGITAELLE